MRIAILLRCFPALSETFILNQITGLIERGHSVTIFAHYREPGIDHPEIVEYNLLERTIYSPTFTGKTRAARILEVTKWLAGCGTLAPRILMSAARAWTSATRPAVSTLVRATMRHMSQANSSFDVIHCHFGPTGLTGTLLRRAGILTGRIVTSFYGYDVSRLPQDLGRDYLSPVFQYSDLVIALSAHMRRRLISLGADPKKTIIHHLGIDPNRFPFYKRTPSADEPIRLISVARLVEKKGVEYSLRAVAEACKHGIALEYRILGDGLLRDHLEALTKQLGLSDNVHFLGRASQEAVTAELSKAQLFVLPSVRAADGDEEGTPTVLLEAMASGLPVLSTRHSGIPEQAPDGQAGFLVPERDVSALAKRLVYLARHPEIWPDLGFSGRRRVEELFDINTLNDELEGHYQRIVG